MLAVCSKSGRLCTLLSAEAWAVASVTSTKTLTRTTAQLGAPEALSECLNLCLELPWFSQCTEYTVLLSVRNVQLYYVGTAVL